MTALDLYKFVTEYNVEWHRADNAGYPDVVLLPYLFHFEEFCKVVKGYDTDEGLEIRVRDGYFGVWMLDLCEYFGVDMDEVFVGEEY